VNEDKELVILMGIIITCCAFIVFALCYPQPSATLQNTGKQFPKHETRNS